MPARRRRGLPWLLRVPRCHGRSKASRARSSQRLVWRHLRSQSARNRQTQTRSPQSRKTLEARKTKEIRLSDRTLTENIFRYWLYNDFFNSMSAQRPFIRHIGAALQRTTVLSGFCGKTTCCGCGKWRLNGRVASITGQARSTLTRENSQPTDSNLAQPSSVILLRARTPICASVF